MGQSGHPAGAVEVRGVERWFGERCAVSGASLTVGEGELVALVGASGSGKTTLLRMIAGFERADAGTIDIGGRRVEGPGAFVEPERRRVGMVFQQGALFPHLTVRRNVEFGAARRARARECLDLVGLADRASAHPHELSGGERQRVALARALAAEPEVILLDEPFAALDAGLRASLREEVARILREAGTSALLVTHDQAEALSLAATVAVMRDGRIEQVGAPEDVYLRPCSRWVAEFLGEADVLPGTACHDAVDCELGRLGLCHAAAGPVEVVIRPESVRIDDRAGVAEAVVVDRVFYGHDHVVTLRLDSGKLLRSRQLGAAPWRVGDRVRVCVAGPVSAVQAERPEELAAV